MSSDDEDISMSDKDLMSEDKEEQYDFKYEDEDEDEDIDVDIENVYYSAKGDADEGKIEDAIEGFETVVDIESDSKSEYGFKSLKQLVKLLHKENRVEEMFERYKQLLTYIKEAVTKNMAEKVVGSILDMLQTQKTELTLHDINEANNSLLERMYDITLTTLKEAKNDRLWFKVKFKLAELCMQTQQFTRLERLIRELQATTKIGDTQQDDPSKATQRLEILALQIQMYTAQKNNKKLKQLYTDSMKIKSAIAHPRIMAVIRECGGKMHTRERDLEKAMEDFYEAFKSYDEAGLPWRIQCLKYLLLTSMLKASDLATFVNPLEANETRAYAKNNEIAVFIELVRFYMDGNIREFEKTLRQYEKFIMDDPFIRENMQELLKTIRSNVLVTILKPYTRVHISYLAKQLFIKDDQVEDLLISMILDDRISGKVDQVSGVLILTDDKQKSSRVNVGTALQSWHGQLSNVHTRVLDKL